MKRASGKSNIDIVKDYMDGNRPFVQVGYTPPAEEKHKDGDTWEDKDGKEWIQIGASKTSKNLHTIKEATRQICSVCKKDIYWGGDRYDEKFFNKTGKCYDCVVSEETEMRKLGTFVVYEKIKVIQNQKAFLTELKSKMEESLVYMENKSNKIEYMNEDGSTEAWTDNNKDHLIAELNKDMTEVNKSLILCNVSIEMLETEMNEIKSTREKTS
jgi:hypothetical protein